MLLTFFTARCRLLSVRGKIQTLQSCFQVFPLCSKPQVIVKNIFRLFDQEREGVVSFRELLLVFTMSMQATPREKLHWLFRIYDIDGNEEIDEDELTEIFMRCAAIQVILLLCSCDSYSSS